MSHQVIVQEIPVVYAGPDTCSVTNLLLAKSGNSALKFSEGGTGFFYGLGDADGAVTQQVKLTHLLRELANSR